jgi:hypothetical protein
MNKAVYYRLIALWVLNEALLGGIIHGFRIPVSGLVVGSAAVVCICLIAYYVPEKGAILKATIIVAIFKMMLSPQASFQAHIAVFFQGLVGELLFRNRSWYRVTCVLFAVVALLESGLQRILVLTFIYGNDFWKVLNDFIGGLTKRKTHLNYSLMIGTAYVALHFIVGIFVGWWASILPAHISKWRKDTKNLLASVAGGSTLSQPTGKRKKRVKAGLLIVWLLLIALYVQSYYNLGTPWLPAHRSLKILVRSIIIILAWYFVLAPMLTKFLFAWLKKKQSVSAEEIQQVLDLLPSTKQLAISSWRHTTRDKGWKRITKWMKLVLVNALHPAQESNFIILSAPIQTGKTSALLEWSGKRLDCYGVLTPVIESKRFFMDVESRELFPMEAVSGEKEVLTVGKYIFSKASFEKASGILQASIHKPGWLIIDEVGPLELRGEGFSDVVKEIVANRKEKVVLVVRKGMEDKAMEYFKLTNCLVIEETSQLLVFAGKA